VLVWETLLSPELSWFTVHADTDNAEGWLHDDNSWIAAGRTAFSVHVRNIAEPRLRIAVHRQDPVPRDGPEPWDDEREFEINRRGAFWVSQATQGPAVDRQLLPTGAGLYRGRARTAYREQVAQAFDALYEKYDDIEDDIEEDIEEDFEEEAAVLDGRELYLIQLWPEHAGWPMIQARRRPTATDHPGHPAQAGHRSPRRRRRRRDRTESRARSRRPTSHLSEAHPSTAPAPGHILTCGRQRFDSLVRRGLANARQQVSADYRPKGWSAISRPLRLASDVSPLWLMAWSGRGFVTGRVAAGGTARGGTSWLPERPD